MTAMALGTIGVLAAGTIAGIAVYNVAAGSTVQARPSAATSSAASASPGMSAPALPAPGDVQLPPMPVIEAPSTDPDPAGTPDASTSEATAGAPDAITGKAATALVLAQAPGSTIKASATTREGYRAWAVQVRRTDGSVVTGFVDRATGVVFEWRLDRKAAANTTGQESGDDDEADRQAEAGEDAGSGEHEHGEGVDDDD